MVSGLTPIMNNGTLIGVAGVDLDLKEVQNIVEAVRPTPNSYAFLVTRKGTFVANPNWPDSVLKQTIGDLAKLLHNTGFEQLGSMMGTDQEGMVEIIDPKSGEPAWAAYHPIGNTG